MDIFLKSHQQVIRANNKKILLLWATAYALVFVLLWGGTLFKIHLDRANLIRIAAIEVAARAKTYAEQVLQTLKQIDQLSLVIKYQWERKSDALDLEEQYRKGVYQTAIYPVAINAQGVAITGTRALPKGTYMGDLDFFQKNKNTPNAGLIISYPTLGRGGLAGKTVVRFSRRFDKADGKFDGVVLVAIESGYLNAFHDASTLAADDFISVRFVDGPELASKVGGEGNKTMAFYRQTPHFTTDDGQRLEPAQQFFDNTARLVAWRKLPDYPLIALAATTAKNALAPNASVEKFYLGIASAVSLLLLLLFASGAISQMRSATRRRYEMQVQATFRLAVDGAREAFYMIQPNFNADGHAYQFLIEDCNERAAEMAGLKRSELIGKCVTGLFEASAAEKIRGFFAKALAEDFWEEEFYVPPGWTHSSGWFQGRAVRSAASIAVTIRDVSEARQQAEALAKMAITDALTGLPNRHWLNDYLPGVLAKATADGKSISVFYIDLDNFKDINDSLGHTAGDEVLCAVARSLRTAVREQDHVTRLGGDEFTVIVESLKQDGDVDKIALQLMDAISILNASDIWKNFSIKASVGISTYPQDAQDVDGLLQCADIAMYAAKADGKSQYRHYDKKFSQKIKERINTEQALQQAISNDEFVLYYQPRAYTANGEFCSMEALIRWQHPQRGLVSPLEFIAIAERTRLIIPIGEWVIDKVCRQIAQWRAADLPLRQVSLNVSALQLKDDRLRLFLVRCMLRHDIPASLIALELTESSMVDEDSVAPEELQQLRAMGIELQIDDFGTGYSSLSQLQRLDIDVVKIDQSFVRKLGQDQQSSALCEAIISIGRTLNITVVAEGVETEEQLNILRQMGCEEVQGFLLSRPVLPDQIAQLLVQGPFFEALRQEAP